MNMRQCGCELGDECTKTTIGALQSAVQDMDDLREEVITYARDYINARDYGTNKHIAYKNLHEAVMLYEAEMADRR